MTGKRFNFLIQVLLITALVANNLHALSTTCLPLTTKEYNYYFGSNNPIKQQLFKYRHQAYKLIIHNQDDHEIYLQSQLSSPTPLSNSKITELLSQSMAGAPWLIGIGWGALLMGVIGLAIIPSIVFGCTLTAAGILGMQNKPLPEHTQHTIKHLLFDGIHKYTISSCTRQEFILVLPIKTEQLTLFYTTDKNDHTQTIQIKLPRKQPRAAA